MLLAALAVVTSPGLRGQEILQLPPPRLSLVPGSVEVLIKQADEFVQDGQAEEAIAIIQRILARFPRQLIEDASASRSGFSRYHPVASECQLWIASLSRRLPRALDIYREQVDPLAERWFSEAKSLSGIRDGAAAPLASRDQLGGGGSDSRQDSAVAACDPRTGKY